MVTVALPTGWLVDCTSQHPSLDAHSEPCTATAVQGLGYSKEHYLPKMV